MKKSFLATTLKLGMVAGLLASTGCAEYHKRVLRDTQGCGSEFNQTLAKEYETLGSIEQEVMYDEYSANYYYCKAILSKEGKTVYPTKLEKWDIDYDKIPELAAARARLMSVLNAGAREKAPKMTAVAQAHFDCWAEQQGEGWQKTDIARCKSAFHRAIAEVEIILRGGFKTLTPTDMIFFAFNSSKIKEGSMLKIKRIAHLAKSMNKKHPHILLVGRTDKKGNESYNKKLSEKRAQVVKKLLVREGFPEELITIRAVGETPGHHVDTHNRRVDIIVLKTW